MLAFILRIPEATLTNAQVCLTFATSIFSTNVSFFKTSGTVPSHRFFDRASFGTFPFRRAAWHSLQTYLQLKSRTGPRYSLIGHLSVFHSTHVTPGASKIPKMFFTLLRRLELLRGLSSPQTAQRTSSKCVGSIRLQAFLMTRSSTSLLAGSGGKCALISGSIFNWSVANGLILAL